MFLNGIDFPNQILDAIKEGSLVVFAGAGASVGKPTSLPNFDDLSKKIAEETGRELGSESSEVFLGALKAGGIDVNGQAAEILSSTCLKHNKLHEAIVDVFRDVGDIRIVTTNYDKMFEQVLLDRGEKPNVYSAPALPLGNDVRGIIHLHGIVDEPQYMVVTDEDFGFAYLTEGYATRFLVKLFETYTILFIGYSYNDTILRYLTRAMSRMNHNKRYILTDDITSDWSILGINEIRYPKRSYAVMREGVIKLGEKSKKNLYDWKMQFSGIKDAPPKDNTVETEIDYCLENIERTRILANSVDGTDWLEALNKRQVFDSCFVYNVDLSEIDRIWANWLSEKIIGHYDDNIKNLLFSHNNTLNSEFANMIAMKIARDIDVGNDSFNEYILITKKYIKNTWIIERLINASCDRKLYNTAYELFKTLLELEVKIDRGFWNNSNSTKLNCVFVGEKWQIEHAWKLIREHCLERFPKEILCLVESKILELHKEYELIKMASENYEPWDLAMLDIEKHKDSYRGSSLYVITDIFEDVSIALNGKGDSIKEEYFKMLESESILLKKLALKALRITENIDVTEVLKILVDKNLIKSWEGKEQVFLLVSDIFKKLSDNEKQLLIEHIDRINPEDPLDYEVYNWYVWLKRIEPENKIVNEKIKKILNLKDYKPREHPELIIDSVSFTWRGNESTFSESDMIRKDTRELIKELISPDYNSHEVFEKEELMNSFSSCVSHNYEWAYKVILVLFEDEIENTCVWQHLFYGLRENTYSFIENREILDLLSKSIDDVCYFKGFVDFFWKYLQKEEIRKNINICEDDCYEIAIELWEHRDEEDYSSISLIDATLNTNVGLILDSLIYLVSYRENQSIPERYKRIFERGLSLNSWEKNVAICILVGHFDFFCYRDKEWTMEILAPLLNSENKEVFRSAWNGVVYYSRRINIDTEDLVAPIYFGAIKHIQWLDEEVVKRFIELLLVLLIYVVDKPTLKYIPEFYKYSTSLNKKEFIETIEYDLRNMKGDVKVDWWNRWLKRFIENRKKNKPVVLDVDENKAILGLINQLDEVYEEAVSILCKGVMPDCVEGTFWFEFKEKKYSDDYPKATAKLVTKILDSSNSLAYEKECIAEIAEGIKGIDTREKKRLQEALLRHDINVLV